MDNAVEAKKQLRSRRRMVWACVALAMLLLLALIPPLFKVNRLHRRIAASMSASLGRTVHLDNVSLHVLPVPGFTLENLVVSEDPAFGSEPVIRANTVEVTLRPSSLWRRQVEFSSIKFVEPSLNLVRNARGEWNLQSLLMHAARVSTAPTEQAKAGPEPRFPYIEATGARVNLKLGEEKKPFSLTEADFALWLPTTQQWRVRLEGKPMRTDRNISDPGTVRLEGGLERAATMPEVPIDLTASWEGAPLGEASKLLNGKDAGWRGKLTVETRLTGKLGAAKLSTRIHLEELRRTDFLPVQSLDLHAECSGTLDVVTAVVSDPDCSMNTPRAEGAKAAGRVVAMADSVDLSTQSASGLHIGMTNISNAWLLDWARLFSQRIPPGERPGGWMAGSVRLDTPPKGAKGESGAAWQGEVHGDVVGALPWKPVLPIASGQANSPVQQKLLEHPISLVSSSTNPGEFDLAPVSLTQPGKTPALLLTGSATMEGYTLRLVGAATISQVMALRDLLPPLGDGLQAGLPEVAGSSPSKLLKMDVTCTRAWGKAQRCAASAPEPAKKEPRRW